MIHHVQRKHIHNPAAINKGLKHWCKVLFIWCLRVADVCSSLLLYYSFLLQRLNRSYTVSTAYYTVKDLSNWWLLSFTVTPVAQRSDSPCISSWLWAWNQTAESQVSLFAPQARALWVQGSEVMGPRRCQPHYPRVHQPNPEGFLSIYVPSDLSLLGNVPLSVVQAVPHSPVYPRLPGASGFKFSLSAAQTCWGRLKTLWELASSVLYCILSSLGGNRNVCISINFVL